MSKVALVTGASAGIGKATAAQLLKDGHTVYVAARRLEQMDDLKDKGAIPVRMDITKEEDIQNTLDTIQQAHGGVDILVNNAGYGSYGAMEDTEIYDARYQFEVNLFGLARLTQLVLPHMRENRYGKIINISSIGGKIYTPLGSWYHATKHALEGWSDCLRLEVKPFGIHVVIIEPGAILTEFGDVAVGPMKERSGNTVYAPMVQKNMEMMEQVYKNNVGSSPQVIADVISTAVKSANPKTRYAKGKYAWTLLFLRRWTSDRMFDWICSNLA